MSTQGVPARGYTCEPLSQCIQGSGLVEIADPTCQSCVTEEFSLDLSKRDVMQVRGERRYQSGVEACGWAGWWRCGLGKQSCVGRHHREASGAVSHYGGWLNFLWVSSALVGPCPHVDTAE